MQQTKIKPVLEVQNLSVEYRTSSGAVKALRDVSINLKTGETFGLAGESGSGKSTLGLAILNYLDENGLITNGDIRLHGDSLLRLDNKAMQSIRGKIIAHVPQDPKTSLNPSITVGEQVAEVLRTHFDYDKIELKRRTAELFSKVGLPEPEHTVERYPHELSGGMQQRVLVAIALACEPDLIIMDEPTSGLDVTTKAKILDLIKKLQESVETTILLVSHDLGEIAETADRVGILYAGELMELGPVDTIFSGSMHPYTRGLLKAVPTEEANSRLEPIQGTIPDLVDLPNGCIFADRCEHADESCQNNKIEMVDVDSESHLSRCKKTDELGKFNHKTTVASDVAKRERTNKDILNLYNIEKYYQDNSIIEQIIGDPKPIRAVDGIDLNIREGETLGLVGESGCGKSTLARTVAGLTDATGGSVKYKGVDINSWDLDNNNRFREETGMVFQNPHSSLNPSKTVYQILRRPIENLTDLEKTQINERIVTLLEQVSLTKNYAQRHVKELSGGEKQRIAIARAFATNPSFVILDEPVSALDLSVQASLVNLLEDLRAEYNCSYLFISHDLSVVKHLCDRIAVMYLGKIMEVGTIEEIFSPPHHPYTRSLLSNISTLDPGSNVTKTHLEGTVPSARDPPSGCNFCTRCPQYKQGVCDIDEPTLEQVPGSGSGHLAACKLNKEELMDTIHK